MQRGAPRNNCACYDGPILVPQCHTKGPKGGLLLWLGQWFDMIEPAQISVAGVFLCSWSPVTLQSRLEHSTGSASRFVSHEPAASLSVTYQQCFFKLFPVHAEKISRPSGGEKKPKKIPPFGR